jgi:YVTN family beta-propeller protein
MTKKLFGLAGLLFLVLARLGAASYAYVSNDSNSVFYIDTTTNTVAGEVADPSGLLNAISFVAISPNEQKVYVANDDGTISIIITSTQEVIGNINAPVGTFDIIRSITFSPNGKKAYVVDGGNLTVSVIDVATDSLDHQVSGLVVPGIDTLYYVVFTPDGKWAYVPITQASPGTVAVIDATADAVVQSIVSPEFNFPRAIAIAPDGKIIYVGNNGSTTISRIDTTTNTVMSPATSDPALTNMQSFALTPDGQKLYTNNFSAIFSLNTVTGAVTGPYAIPVDSEIASLGVTPDGKTLYAPNAAGTTVITIDVASDAVGAVVDTGSVFDQPKWLGMPGSVQAPTGLKSTKTSDTFLAQVDLINALSWTAPTGIAPASYSVYRNDALTDLAGTTQTTSFADHNRNPGVPYTYYVVSVSQFGIKSSPAILTVP